MSIRQYSNLVDAVYGAMCMNCDNVNDKCDADQMARCVKKKMTILWPLMEGKPTE